ncbi:MAG: SMEK 2, suppressor of mek1 (Dictyostelium), partial [Paramarteilia canceri]
DTIIVWSESDKECALSFQSKLDCDEIYNYIQTVKKLDPSCSSDFAVPSENYLDIPKCDLDNLEQLAQSLEQCVIFSETYEYLLERGNYFNKTIELIKHCLENDLTNNLKHLSKICMCYVYFNKQYILDILFCKENLFNTVEALQYDPASGEKLKDHAQVLKNNAKLKHMIPATKDDIIIQKIEHTYHLQYILDNFFPSHNNVDKARISALYSAIHLNKIEIVSIILEQTEDLKDLLKNLVQFCPDDCSNYELKQKAIDTLLFFKDLCDCVQPLDHKDDFFKVLIDLNFFDALFSIFRALNNSKITKKEFQNSYSLTGQKALELLIKLIDFSPAMFHDYIIQKKKSEIEDGSSDIFSYLIDFVHADLFDCQDEKPLALENIDKLTNILPTINTISTLLGFNSEVEYNQITLQNFTEHFYQTHAIKLFKPLYIAAPKSDNTWHYFLQYQLIQLVIEILRHAEDFSRCFNFIKKHNLLENLDHLCFSSAPFSLHNNLVLLQHELLLSGDQVIQNFVIQSQFSLKMFSTVFPLYFNSHSIITGSISYLLERIRLDGSTSLQEIVVENFDTYLESFNLNESYKELKARVLHFKEASAACKKDNKQIDFNSSSITVEMSDTKSSVDEWIESDDKDENSSSKDSKAVLNIEKNDEFLNTLDKQYENIFMDLKPGGSTALGHDQMPGLFSPRPNSFLKQNINFKLKNITNQPENGCTENTLVDYAASSSSEDDKIENKESDDGAEDVVVKKLKLQGD